MLTKLDAQGAGVMFGEGADLLSVEGTRLPFGNRWMDPTIGRWISEDPIGFDGEDENLHRYVGNNPISRVDPNGLQMEEGPFANPGAWEQTGTGVWVGDHGVFWDISNGHRFGPMGEKLAIVTDLPIGRIADTRIAINVNAKCLCKDDKWFVDPEKTSVQLAIMVTIFPTDNKNKLDWAKRAEQDHVNDFQKWMPSVPRVIDSEVETHKTTSYENQAECERKTRNNIFLAILTSFNKAATASQKEWDLKGQHTWGGPNQRP